MAAARLALAPETTSAAGARRWVATVLAGLPGELVDTATLLTSETVTNAVLHAGTDIEIAVHRSADRVRIDVADHSPLIPVAKQFAADAATGRGLVLLQAMAAAWGVEVGPEGKVVWFELVAPDAPGGGAPGSAGDSRAAAVVDLATWDDLEDWPAAAGPPPVAGGAVATGDPQGDEHGGPAAGGDEDQDEDEVGLVEVRLLGVPLDLLDRTSEQYDALFREFRLMVALDPGDGHAVPGRLLALGDELTTQYAPFTVGTDEMLSGARARGDATVDLEYRLPVEVGPAARHYDALLDQADAYCRAGEELLTLAPPPDATAFRRWVLGEFVRQTAGRPPVAWGDSVRPLPS